jgi:hypothetical protein
MSKITSRPKLARGTKLYPAHTHEALSAAATALSGNMEPDQLACPKGTFRFSWNIPTLGSGFFFHPGSTKAERAFSIPFIIPPFQEDMSLFAKVARTTDGTFNYSPAAPKFIADEISIGFDTRDEAAVIADYRFNQNPAAPINVAVNNSGMMDFSNVDKLGLRVAIHEHRMTYWDKQEDIPTSASFETDLGKEIWSANLANALYAGKNFRRNPIIITDLDLELAVHRTYVLTITSPGLTGDNTAHAESFNYCLPSLTISMKVKSDLTSRDAGTSIQNIPTKHAGSPTNASLTVSTPAVNSTIEADNAVSGISVSLNTVDAEFRDGLKGGYDANCETAIAQNLLKDSSYEVIAVPLMQGRWGGHVESAHVLNEPYIKPIGTAGLGNQVLADRRIVPLHHPIVVHHAFLAWNWQVSASPTSVTSPLAYTIPTSAGFTVKVGVGMGSMIKSDFFTYSPIAYHSMVAPDFSTNAGSTWYARCVDRVRVNTINFDNPQCAAVLAAFADGRWWDWEFHQLPLDGSGGAGYFTPQGRPIYAGKAWLPTSARSNMQSSGAVATTLGMENFLEVRMHINDTVTAGGLEAAAANIYSGYQGHWVYLFCKKAVL